MKTSLAPSLPDKSPSRHKGRQSCFRRQNQLPRLEKELLLTLENILRLVPATAVVRIKISLWLLQRDLIGGGQKQWRPLGLAALWYSLWSDDLPAIRDCLRPALETAQTATAVHNQPTVAGLGRCEMLYDMFNATPGVPVICSARRNLQKRDGPLENNKLECDLPLAAHT
ncbi:hypothetical protein RRG08_066724 [Elysia crispata]|uniref:Uncharacterized protein n=1 Tax=Elysia crispata TaxID=231223 RepID=A0AAE1B827_9GAST|nr:hypothetical protein RRG08_066724 [Elysia crispata]